MAKICEVLRLSQLTGMIVAAVASVVSSSGPNFSSQWMQKPNFFSGSSFSSSVAFLFSWFSPDVSSLETLLVVVVVKLRFCMVWRFATAVKSETQSSISDFTSSVPLTWRENKTARMLRAGAATIASRVFCCSARLLDLVGAEYFLRWSFSLLDGTKGERQ